jgi:putative heme iron utilization protein
MEAQWIADRQHLQQLLQTQPAWTHQDLAEATGRSLGWVKKWLRHEVVVMPVELA